MRENIYKKNIFINLMWIIKNIRFVDKKYIPISIFNMILSGIVPPVSLLIMQSIINKIQLGFEGNYIFILIATYVMVDLVQIVIENIFWYYNSKFMMRFNLAFSEKIYIKASKLSLENYEDSKTYDLINRAQYESGGKLVGYFNNFTGIITQCITLISYLGILYYFKQWIVLVVMILPTIKYFTTNYFNIKKFEIYKNRTNDSRKSWYLSHILTYGNCYKELKMFNLFDYFINKYKEIIQRFNNQDLKINKKQVMVFSVIGIFETIIDGLLFSYTVILGINKVILIGNVITYTRTIINSKTSISSVLNSFSSAINESLFIEQLYEYLNMDEVNNEGKIKIDKIEKIELINVSYKYKNAKKYSVKNISLEISDNKKIALIGMNGSGKTTLIKLIMGFYSDYEGHILINDIELSKIDKDSLHSNISSLFQDFVKYQATFRENIAYGNLSIMNDDHKINDIVYRFNLTDMIKNNDKKLDTQLGVWFDKGVNLSAGQWQKVALSRIFARDSDLYILDEPNAAMDSITENEISSLYKNILKDKLGILITHKFTNIIKVIDYIYVLQDGEIVGQGTHGKLLKECYLYRRLNELDKYKKY